ncbi:hypothetical protein NDY24_21180 [Xanthomonas hortorum pv. pelargonii]|nr:hypothetical protein NDY24_21180 [Xanthomonas hortorum pv. pelargonii]
MAALLAGIALLAPTLTDPTRSTAVVVCALMLLTLLSGQPWHLCQRHRHLHHRRGSRPLANAAQVGGSYLGIPLGVFGFLAVAQQAGWTAGFLCMAGLSLLLPLIPVLLVRQPFAHRTLPRSPGSIPPACAC